MSDMTDRIRELENENETVRAALTEQAKTLQAFIDLAAKQNATIEKVREACEKEREDTGAMIWCHIILDILDGDAP